MKNHTTTEELHSGNIQESDNLLMSEQAGYHQHYSILQMSHIYTHAHTQIHLLPDIVFTLYSTIFLDPSKSDISMLCMSICKRCILYCICIILEVH